GADERVAFEIDEVCHLRPNVEIGMLAKERKPGDSTTLNLDRFHLINFSDLRKPDVLQDQLQRRVREVTATILRHYDVLDLVTQLQERFEHTVVLVIVCDERVIDLLGEVAKAVALDAARARIADHWITQDAGMFRFNQNAGMTKVANTHTRTLKFRTRRRCFVSEESRKELRLIRLDSQGFNCASHRLRRVLH